MVHSITFQFGQLPRSVENWYRSIGPIHSYEHFVDALAEEGVRGRWDQDGLFEISSEGSELMLFILKWS